LQKSDKASLHGASEGALCNTYRSQHTEIFPQSFGRLWTFR
jgi:hypothetical protein